MSTASLNTTLVPDRNDRRADGEVKTIAPHPDLYFEDGNLILSAERHLFRVHRSVLAKHSPVLSGLFDHKRDWLHGCPHVHLDHTSEELANLIQVIYDGCRIRDVYPMTTDTFPTFSSILRMTIRYGIHHVAAAIVSRIRAQWPSDLAKYSTKATPAPALQPNAPSAPSPAHPAAVIALLRGSGYLDPSLLFPLFSALSTMSLRSGADALSRHVALLSAEDIACLLVGIERLRAVHVRLAACPPCPKESGAHWCTRGVAELWAWIRWRTRLDLVDPVRAWAEAAREARAPGALAKYAMCAQCAKDVGGYLDEVPAQLWRSLPVVFGFVGGSRA